MAKIKQNIETDIIVVGGGLVGLAAAISFAEQGKSIVLVDAKKPKVKNTKTWDERIYALTPATENWLRALGVWQFVDQTRVNEIHAMQLWNDVSESPLLLTDSDANLTKLGLIAENNNLMHALRAKLESLSGPVIINSFCKHIENTEQYIQLDLENGMRISAKLLVAADGVHSFVRRQLNISTKLKPFNQTAIVANFSAEKNHDNIARQWFAPHETLALLPLPQKHISMVWSVSDEQAGRLLALANKELTELVQAQSKNVLGELKPVSEVLSFELSQITATQLIANRVAIVGDAAHQIHPMAGQGLNLGFRDVIALQGLLAKAHVMQDIGEKTFLRQYERARKADIVSMSSLVSGLDYLFAGEQSVLKTLGVWGMSQLNSQTFFKKLLIKHAVA